MSRSSVSPHNTSSTKPICSMILIALDSIEGLIISQIQNWHNLDFDGFSIQVNINAFLKFSELFNNIHKRPRSVCSSINVVLDIVTGNMLLIEGVTYVGSVGSDAFFLVWSDNVVRVEIILVKI